MYLSKGLTLNQIPENTKGQSLIRCSLFLDLRFLFIETKLLCFVCLFLRKSGLLQRAGCNFTFPFLRFKAIQSY